MPFSDQQLIISIEDLIEELNPQEEEISEVAICGETSVENIEIEHQLTSKIYQDFKVEFDPEQYQQIKEGLDLCLEDRLFKTIYDNFFDGKAQNSQTIDQFLSSVYEVETRWIVAKEDCWENYPQVLTPYHERVIVVIEVKKAG